VKGIICETPRTNVLQAAEQREPSVKVVAQLAAMTEEAINKSAAITIGNWWNQSGPSTQPKILKAEWLKNKRAAAGAPPKNRQQSAPMKRARRVAEATSPQTMRAPGWLSIIALLAIFLLRRTPKPRL